MRIHRCGRCEGCGYVTGAFRWEIPWSRWASLQDQQHGEGVFEARACPDCGGTGALIEMGAPTLPSYVSRRGLPRDDYADRVNALLSARPNLLH